MKFSPRQPDHKIDEFLDAFASGWAAMDWRTFADTIDMFYYDPLIAEPWTRLRTLRILDVLEQSSLDGRDVARLLHNNPSAIRCLLLFDLFMALCIQSGTTVYHRIFSFYTTVLEALCKEDIFAHGKRNIIHTPEEAVRLARRAQPATATIARALGRLSSACYNLSYALYSDMNPQLVYDNFGPYLERDGKMFAVKIFHNLKPVDLWPETAALAAQEIDIGVLFEGVTLTVDNVTHAIYTGDQIHGLRGWWCMIDGKPVTSVDEIDTLRKSIEQMAVTMYQKMKGLSLEEKKELYWHQKAWGYKYLLDHLGMDWKPPKEVIDHARGKPLFTKWNISNDKVRAMSMFKAILDPRTDIPDSAYL